MRALIFIIVLYTFIFSQQLYAQVPVNDECENAIELVCGESYSGNISTATISSTDCVNNNDVWFTFVGDGIFYSFEFLNLSINDIVLVVFEGDCNSSILTNCDGSILFNNTPFLAVEGVTYLFNLSTIFIPGEFSFSVSCFPPPSNDECVNAIHLNCGDQFQVDLFAATATGLFNGCTSEFFTDVWYMIEGDGESYFIESLNEDFFSAEIFFYDEPCGLEYTNCFESSSVFSDGDVSNLLETIPGQDYWIRIVGDGDGGTLLLNCNSNDDCDNAEEITCGQLISDNITHATASGINNGCTDEIEPDLWYTIQGSDEFVVFENIFIPFNSNNIGIEIYEGPCSSNFSNCSLNFNLSSGQQSSFFAMSGISYLIRVHLNFNTGPFDLSVNCEQRSNNDLCEDALPVSCGQTLTSTILTASSQGEFNGCYNEVDTDVWFQIVGDGNIYDISNVSGPESNIVTLEVYEETCSQTYTICREQFFLRDFSNFPQSIPTEIGVTYYLRAYFLDEPQTNLQLQLQFDCRTPIENDNCSQAIPVSCGEDFEGNLANATFTGIDNGCVIENRPDLWYSIEGNNEIIAFSLSSVSNGPVMFAAYTEECSADNRSCFIQSLLSNTSQSVRFFGESGTTYIFQLSKFDNLIAETEFSFRATCLETADNDICINAIPLECELRIEGNVEMASPDLNLPACDFSPDFNNGIWYQFVGDGSIMNLHLVNSNNNTRVNIYTGDCSDLTCVDIDAPPSASPISIRTIENELYYVLATQFGVNLDGIVELFLQCEEDVLNDECINSIPISCGETVIGNNVTATLDINNIECGASVQEGQGIWYSLIGDGSILSIQMEANFTPVVHIYDDCTSNICLDQEYDPFSLNILEEPYTFQTLPNVEYFILISGQVPSDIGNFELSLDCLVIPSNDFCQSAIPIECGLPLIGETNLATPDLDFANCGNSNAMGPGIWYSIVGTGNPILFELIQADFVPSIHFYEVGCNSTTCINPDFDISNTFNSPENDVYTFNSVPDTEYVVYISSQAESAFGSFEFSISCDVSEEEPVQDIPTLSEWALICLTLLLLIVGVVALKQENVALAESM